MGCSAFDEDSIEGINQIKGRSSDKSFILLVDSDARLQQLVNVPELAWDLMDLSEKPLTIIYDKPLLDLPKSLLSADGSIAVRKVDLLVCKKIISRLNAPLVSTSANISGKPSPRSFSEISKEVKEQVDEIINFNEEEKMTQSPSSIIKLTVSGVIKVIRD